jgi:hypothetical protein
MATDKMKPNKVTRKDADEVFRATATEPLRRKARGNEYLRRTQAERDRDLAEAQAIVDKTKGKKKKS